VLQDQPHHMFKRHMGQRCNMQRHPMTPLRLIRLERNLFRRSPEYYFFLREWWIQLCSPHTALSRPNRRHLRKETIQTCLQFLDYAALQEDAIVTYRASDIKLAIHSNASYLSEPKACSRAGGHMFMAGMEEIPINNGAVLNILQIIKAVMSSAAEAKLGALFINGKMAVSMQWTLEELGHPQLRTPIQTDNLTAHALITNKILPKALKAMDM
jgi:hypothetical protein